MDNWVKKDHASGKYFPRPPFGRLRSVPLWEKKFCESIGLIPWHKLLEAKKFMYLYEDINKWNDTAAKEAFKNAKSRFWAEMNGLPCNIKLPDPDIYIEKVDWNTSIDPELLSDLERGPDIQSNSVGAEGDSVTQSTIPFMLESAPIVGSSGWGDIDEVPLPVVPAEPAEPQGWMNYHETTNTFSSNDDANKPGSLDLQGDLNIYKGWNNWDDADNYVSECDLKELSKKDSKGKASYSNSNWGHGSYTNGINVEIVESGRNLAPQNNHWRRKDGKGYEGEVRSSQRRADWKFPMVTHNKKGKQRHERPRWAGADRTPSYGRG